GAGGLVLSCDGVLAGFGFQLLELQFQLVEHLATALGRLAVRSRRSLAITSFICAIIASAPAARAAAAVRSSRCRRISACASARSVGRGMSVDTPPVLPHYGATRFSQLKGESKGRSL